MSTISNTWKVCLIGSFFGCLTVLFFLDQNDQIQSFSSATMHELSPLGEAQAPAYTMASDPPKSSISRPYSAASSQRVTSPVNETAELANFSSKTIEPQRNSTQINHVEKVTNKTTDQKKCDMFEGQWVYKLDENPAYDANTCPLIEEKMSCRKNGRPDFEYEKWRWEANGCDVPLFNGRDMLERLRNKRVIIVGDSLNRNMWESLSCLLYSSVPSNGVEFQTKDSQYKVLKAKDYNTTVEFHWSPYLVEYDVRHNHGKKVLVLDNLSPNFKKWLGADVMVFNSGHWWTHMGKVRKWDLIQYKGQLSKEMSVELAYERSMKTWSKWIENNVDPKKTTVFFRSVSGQHNGRRGCYNVTHPTVDESLVHHFPKALINVIENMMKGITNLQVKYLNITKLSEYRTDAHPSVYRSKTWKIYTTKYKSITPSGDCTHWCLPGLPDTWNRLLYASLFFENSRNMPRS